MHKIKLWVASDYDCIGSRYFDNLVNPGQDRLAAIAFSYDRRLFELV